MDQYNQAPANLEEISEKDFSSSDFFIFDFVKKEYRQITKPSPDTKVTINGYLPIKMFWMPQGHGWGMTNDVMRNKVRYFRFGCKHDWTSVRIGFCLHNQTCKLCGHKSDIDSSG